MASSRVVWANSFVLLVCLANLAQAAFFRGDEKLGVIAYIRIQRAPCVACSGQGAVG
jgi:hypothetical protein